MKLIKIEGVSGDECEVRSILANEIKKYVKEVYMDKFGNLIAYKKGKKPSILLAAHMDEVGLMIKRIDKFGRIFISAIGGIEAYSLIGEKVNIKTKKNGEIKGIITMYDMQDGYPVEKLPEMKDIYVDTGLKKEELDKKGVEPGIYLYFDTVGGTLGKKEIIYGKALDDRIGCYQLVELAKRLKKFDREIYFIFTVQEEVGLYGAKTSSANISPDIGLIMETTTANDSFDEPTKSLGKGPCITIKDEGMITNSKINELLIDIAKKNKISIQLEVSNFGTTDGLSISLSNGGVPTSVIGVAVRNIHTSVSIAHMNDVDNGIKLAEKFIREVKFTPKKQIIKEGSHVMK